jgi:hypothetical protein
LLVSFRHKIKTKHRFNSMMLLIHPQVPILPSGMSIIDVKQY